MSRDYEPLVIRNFFTEAELDSIWYELKFLAQPHLLQDPEHTGTATENDKPIKQNKGIFFADIYRSFDQSSIYTAGQKLFKGITEDFSEMSFANWPVLQTTHSRWLLSYYEDSDHYAPHRDTATTTVLFWFCQEPRAFTGGDLHFHEIDETVKFESNTMVMFPSWATHSVDPVKMKEKTGPHQGRFCVTAFLSYVI
jgi:hypothetical protein